MVNIIIITRHQTVWIYLVYYYYYIFTVIVHI